MKDNKDLKLAVLIDADNIPYSNVKGMLNEIAKFGIPTIKRIYGDWTKPTVSKGKSIREAHELAVEVSAYVCTQNGAMPELPISIKSRLL